MPQATDTGGNRDCTVDPSHPSGVRDACGCSMLFSVTGRSRVIVSCAKLGGFYPWSVLGTTVGGHCFKYVFFEFQPEEWRTDTYRHICDVGHLFGCEWIFGYVWLSQCESPISLWWWTLPFSSRFLIDGYDSKSRKTQHSNIDRCLWIYRRYHLWRWWRYLFVEESTCIR